MATEPNITAEQRANLAKLAAYLRTLPVEYPDFAMSAFVQDGAGGGHDKAYVPVCGTAACAAGHGPVAGIAPLDGETWLVYSRRAFATGDEWQWCFDEDWSQIDNTAHGAAARIEYLLNTGLPGDWEEQMFGEIDAVYQLVTAA